MKNLELEANWIKNGLRVPAPEDPNVTEWKHKHVPSQRDRYFLTFLLYEGKTKFEEQCHMAGHKPSEVLSRNDLDDSGFCLTDD